MSPDHERWGSSLKRWWKTDFSGENSLKKLISDECFFGVSTFWATGGSEGPSINYKPWSRNTLLMRLQPKRSPLGIQHCKKGRETHILSLNTFSQEQQNRIREFTCSLGLLLISITTNRGCQVLLGAVAWWQNGFAKRGLIHRINGTKSPVPNHSSCPDGGHFVSVNNKDSFSSRDQTTTCFVP